MARQDEPWGYYIIINVESGLTGSPKLHSVEKTSWQDYIGKAQQPIQQLTWTYKE